MTYQEEHSEKKRIRMKFQPEEDEKLKQLVAQFGTNSWELIAKQMEGRNVRQCRERWNHYLCSETAKRPWTKEEDAMLIQKVEEYGTKWSKIISFFQDRTDIQAKTRWLRLTGRRTVHEYVKQNVFQVQESPKPAKINEQPIYSASNVQAIKQEDSLEIPVHSYPIQQNNFSQAINISINNINQFSLYPAQVNDVQVPSVNFQNGIQTEQIFQLPNLQFSSDPFSLFLNTEDYDPDDEISLFMPKENYWETNYLLGDLL